MAEHIPPLETSHWAADWLRRQNREVSPLGERVAAVLAVVFSGIYNAPKSARGADFSNPVWVEVLVDTGLDLWDSNRLTRLVVACHDAALRVEVNPRTFRHLLLVFSARSRDNSAVHRWCPTIDEAVQLVRKHYEVPTHALALEVPDAA